MLKTNRNLKIKENMATEINNTITIASYKSPGVYSSTRSSIRYISDTSGSVDWAQSGWNSYNHGIIDFIEFSLKIMGVDLKYSNFMEMSDQDKAAFIRDLKIGRVLDENQ
jgi:hypothetical protein